MGKPVVSGWKLGEEERSNLLRRFPPRYERTIADHVTLEVGDGKSNPLPDPVKARVVLAGADDGDSLECLVVEVDGTTDLPDGSIFHITWSLGQGRGAKESNEVLRERGWEAIGDPIPLDLKPALF